MSETVAVFEDVEKNQTVRRRLNQYILISAGLVILYYLSSSFEWRGNAQLHTIMEVVATLLALFVGILALVLYYSKKNNTILFVGAAFLGTSFLNLYHAVVTSDIHFYFVPSELSALTQWSWVASQAFLSLMLFLSYWGWRKEETQHKDGAISEITVFSFTFILTIISFLFFIYYPLPPAYYPDFIFGRPGEFIPAVFFLFALVGYFKKGRWKFEGFEHWLIIAIIINVINEAVFMSRSNSLYDLEFNAAHILKLASYISVLIGLLYSVYQSFLENVKITNDLIRSNEDLEQFAYIASHDLKAPLRAIDNLSLWLQEDLEDVLEGDPKENMKILRQRIVRMETLLDDLLNFSRAGRVPYVIVRANVKEVLNDVVHLMNIPESFTLVLPEKNPTIVTAKAALEQVFRNLIGNAIKHHDRLEGKIKIEISDARNFIEIAISDDGPGIPQGFHEKIFLMFHTLKPRDTVEGSGMGLSMVKKLIQSQGGWINVESTMGSRGTTFRFLWPKLWKNKGE